MEVKLTHNSCIVLYGITSSCESILGTVVFVQILENKEVFNGLVPDATFFLTLEFAI